MGLPTLNLYPTKGKNGLELLWNLGWKQFYTNTGIKTTKMSCSVITNSIMILQLPRSLWTEGSRDTKFPDFLFLLADLKINNN